MQHKLVYDSLIKNAVNKNRARKDGCYYECHHIVPSSLGGSNKKENKVLLTAKEHFVAHHLLWKIYKNPSMALAFLAMQVVGGKTALRSKFKINAKEYALLKASGSRKLIQTGNKVFNLKLGVHGLSPEQRVISGINSKNNKLGVHALSKEELLICCSQAGNKAVKSGQLKVATSNSTKSRAKTSTEKWLNEIKNSNVKDVFSINKKTAKELKITYFIGSVCIKHPSLQGKRYTSTSKCPDCNSERKVKYYRELNKHV